MINSKKIEAIIGTILLAGMLASLLFVLLGGSWYLIQHSSEPLTFECLPVGTYRLDPFMILRNFLTFSPLDLIEFGLLLLVLTQILRISCLIVFYLINIDVPFTLISTFILLVLIYSLFLRHYSF